MKIKKLYLQNFKGIYEKKIIHFDSHVSLLTGPNGFGKTTIFDVLELCLTGKIYRTSQKSDVTKHQKDYAKPFYQNTLGQDVLVKVWLSKCEDGNEENLVITRHLPKDHDGRTGGSGRRNKPTDFDLLNMYSENIENFDKEEFDKSKANPID
ncbi:AAA family ATPase [Staphylococcus equorum]|uniref:AAA family ATPase n=1 Tax=Staphylococcus equorum TaxID=246432 RepID=UPI003CEF874F